MGLIKGLIAKKTIKFKILENKDGLCIVKIETVFKASEEIESYDYLLKRVPSIIKDIKSVSLDYKDLIATIKYNQEILEPNKVLDILEISKEVIIDNLDYIKENYENNLEEVVDSMEVKLREKFKTIL